MIRPTPLLVLAPLLAGLPSAAQTTLGQYPGNPDAYLSNCVGGHDLNADGVPDLVLGARYDNTVGNDAGAVYVRSGATGDLLWWRFGGSVDAYFGAALAMSPDLDGDGVWEVVVGAPGGGALDRGVVYVLSGRTSAMLKYILGPEAGSGFGSAVAADFDWNHDGLPDVAGGAPFFNGAKGAFYVYSGPGVSNTYLGGGTGSGALNILVGASLLGTGDMDGDGYGDLAMANYSAATVFGPQYIASQGGMSLGIALGRAGDVDSDGRPDLLIGDPNHDTTLSEAGIVWALGMPASGLPSLIPLAQGELADQHFGSAVAGLGDIDGDGWEDWAFSATGTVSGPGHVRVISGRFQQELYRLSGLPVTQYPLHVAGVGDLNSDGVPDLAVGDATASSDDGLVQVFSGYGPGIVDYCTAGTSASGCQATLSASGTPSAFQGLPFTLSATGVEGDTPGLFFYGWNGRQANAWGNGSSLQCVEPPVKRGGLLPKAGTKNQCDGQFVQDLNMHWSGKPSVNPGPGAVVQAQLWYRDPASTSNQTTSLSDALEFVVGI